MNVDVHAGPEVQGSLSDHADTGGTDVAEGSGQLRVPGGKEHGFALRANRLFGQLW
jgi:hypothetical protein